MKAIYLNIDEAIDVDTESVRAAGIEVEFYNCRTEDELVSHCRDADIFVLQFIEINAHIMDALPCLKCIIRYGVGVDNIEVAEAVKRGITVCNIPDYGVAEVSDHALALMLALTRKVMFMDSVARTKGWYCWESGPIHRLSTMTVGIVGLGRIGRAFAEKIHALGCRILACDHHLAPGETDSCGYITGASLEELYRQSDVISFHCQPMKNGFVFDKSSVKLLKKGAYLINVARGNVVESEALIEALNSGVLSGAGIDVAQNEPLKTDDPLFNCPNIIINPHVAWYSLEAVEDLKNKVAQQVIRFAQTGTVSYPLYKN